MAGVRCSPELQRAQNKNLAANVAGRTFEDSDKNREIFVSLAVMEELLGEHERLNVEGRIYAKFLSLHNGPPVRIYRT